MPEMGKYCKAYLAKQFRAFGAWQPDLTQLRPEEDEHGEAKTEPRETLADDDILYLQDTYVVTDGIFQDEHIIFDQVTDEWKAFCSDELAFEIPDFGPPEEIEASPEESEEAAAETASAE